ncbi:membrane protein insertase YidC [Luteolibacter yonseiensis]|uniref:Membrane protein insertase YidC n=1 Tax=Luteolibacter yonseiensis TaxID=1144680 RepID=A0A934V766_9BACT|nr:membrane protein insertase YidC [Luteolibacter yonseiensis]MBK1815812.1 membrane protein insertase YidC [Luteolibacter yonseiensis]
MYDRKTWVALILCGGLVAANLYYSSQNSAEQARKEAIAKALAPPAPGPNDIITTDAGLSVETPPPPTEEENIILENDEVVFTLTNIGGGIKHAEFKNQKKVGSKTELVRINNNAAGPIGGLAGAGEILENIPFAYKEEESEKGRKAVYIAKLPSGLIAKKTFSLIEPETDPKDPSKKIVKPGAPYLLNYQLNLENRAANAVNLNQWSIFLGEAAPLYQSETPDQTGFFWHTDGDMHFKAGTGFKGGMLWGAAQSIIKSDSTSPVEYAGVTDQFFTTVIRPKEPAVANVWGKPGEIRLTTDAKALTTVRGGLPLPSATLAPTEQKTLDYLIFVGPKHNRMLRQMDSHAAWGTGWGDVMQYGWFGIVSRTLNFVLNTFHGWIDGIAKNWSWGLAVILLTIAVRIVIWPLHAKSTHTMKKMAKLQPEMAKIKEKYPDDPNKVNTETMGLYRKYGINPLGGCLPMFLQIPIFFGFFKMLQYAVELRGQGFLWVPDLSQPDTLLHISFLGNIPLNILPIVMAITSFLQIKMTPKTGDATQQKIMLFMPFMFFFFCYNFASALALYWTTQNIFSIGQTWLMNKVPEPELKVRTSGDKKSFVQRMAEKQAEMQKAQKAGGGGNMRDVTPADSKKKPRPPRTGG